VLESGEIQFVRIKVQCAFEDAKRFVLIEYSNGKKVADLEDEAASLLQQRRLGAREMLSQNDNLLLTGKMCLQIGKGFFRILRKLGEHISELRRSLKPLV
jgi:hypothetical protein